MKYRNAEMKWKMCKKKINKIVRKMSCNATKYEFKCAVHNAKNLKYRIKYVL